MKNLKCLITDAVYPGIAEELGRYIHVTTTGGKPLTKAELMEKIGEYDILVMRVDPKIDREVLDAAKNLKMIGVCAVGTNHIDMEYAEEKGIKVFNAPGMNANAVAELTIAKMLEVSRHTIPANYDVKVNHNWDKYKFVGRELRGKTLGIMGFGRIGRRVCELGKAFKMRIVAYDPYLRPDQFEAEGARGASIEELIRVSDFIAIHVPLTRETRDMINKDSIATMKKGAVVLNMSRGGIVNEKDMYEALKEGRIGGYAADVLENELAGSGLTGHDEFVNPLFECENFIVTPHLGAQSEDAAKDVGIYITGKIKNMLGLNREEF